MKLFLYQWKYVLKIPFQERVHEVLHAFLRTSEHGEWVPDEAAVNDAFVLNYRRGTWKTPLFGQQLVPDLKSPLTLQTYPMRLRVTIRPGPSDVTIGVYHTAPCTTMANRQMLDNHVQAELKALADYLREVYDLPEPPKIGVAD